MRVAVTGATGFVGRRLVAMLRQRALEPVPMVRGASDLDGAVVIGDLADGLGVDAAARRIGALDALVHLAAKTSAGDDRDTDAAFQAANVGGTLAAVALAARTGARHFVFVSSIKVHGDRSLPDHPLIETSPREPDDAYGRSKRDAEDAVIVACANAGIALTIVRPPLVYGPGAKANLAGLARLAASGLPLPLGGIDNRRSLLFVDNLCDFLIVALTHPRARGETFLLSDGAPVSVSDLVRLLARGRGRRVRLLPAPIGLIRMSARLLRRDAIATRLLDDLAVDASKAKALLGWTAPASTEQALPRQV